MDYHERLLHTLPLEELYRRLENAESRYLSNADLANSLPTGSQGIYHREEAHAMFSRARELRRAINVAEGHAPEDHGPDGEPLLY